MSPVIGVVMMVGVTVVLAAVLGTYLLDFGDRTMAPAPSASLALHPETGADNVTVRHRGGDALRTGAVRLRVRITNGTTTSTATYDSTSPGGQLAVGGTARVTVGTAIDGVDWPAGGALEFTNYDDEFGPLERGDRVTLTVVHTPSQRIVFEAAVTV